MKILFDHGVPKPLQSFLPSHAVSRVFQLGWARKKNGELLMLAENAGFQIFITTDQNLRYQQNFFRRSIAVFILGRGNWPEIKPLATQIAEKINSIKEPGVYFFPIPPES